MGTYTSANQHPNDAPDASPERHDKCPQFVTPTEAAVIFAGESAHQRVPAPARNPTPTPTAICPLRPRLTSSPDILARENVAVAPRPSSLRTTVSAAAVTTVPERRRLLPASSSVIRIRDPGTIADGSCDHATVGDSSKAIVPSQMRRRAPPRADSFKRRLGGRRNGRCPEAALDVCEQTAERT